MPTPWSTPQIDIHPVGEWDLLQATAWRQATADELTQSRGDEYLTSPTLSTWLRDTGPGTSLQIAARVGGGLPLALWLGLSSRAESHDAAVQSLHERTTDLGALLDIWGQFQHPTPTPPPAIRPDSLYLCSTTDDNETLLENNAEYGYQGPAFFPTVFQSLSAHPTPISVQFTLSPTLNDVEILRHTEQAMRQLRARSADQLSTHDQNTFARLLFVRDRAVSSRTTTRLDGAPPRSIQAWLATALSNDLMADVEFRPTPQQLDLHTNRVNQVLQFLSVHTGQQSTPDVHQAFLEGRVPF